MEEITSGCLIRHDIYGKGKVVHVDESFYKIDFGVKGIIDIATRNIDKITLLSAPVNNIIPSDADEDTITEVLTRILEKYNATQEVVPMGDKWEGGKIILQPANPSLKSKEIPMEVFFHKIVMLRDRLRVLEQQINSNGKMSDEEKVNLQQYITRCYGSLTTFNILFKNNDQVFTGEKSANS
jgi:hypothetical protein